MINCFCFSSISVLRAGSSGSSAETSDPAAARDRPTSQRGLWGRLRWEPVLTLTSVLLTVTLSYHTTTTPTTASTETIHLQARPSRLPSWEAASAAYPSPGTQLCITFKATGKGFFYIERVFNLWCVKYESIKILLMNALSVTFTILVNLN